ncbi:MAG: HAD hydrolase-like protein [Candidatus Shapirobacteria bacterium]|nr:HAD hydrolase-like protein [Candidatus Shapirobacteria bacterium]
MKQVEDLRVSPVERELLFCEWKRLKGIKYFVFDLDDTGCNTSIAFDQQKNICLSYLSSRLKVDGNKAEVSYRKFNDKSYEIHGVNPSRWSWVVEKTCNNLGSRNHEVIKTATEILMGIYEIPLQLFPETAGCFDFLNKTETNFGIITHANVEWTEKKYWDWLGLDKWLARNQIYIVDENGHKGPKQWLEGISFFGYKPREVMVAGDSPKSDIEPSQKIGVQERCLVRRNDRLWKVQEASVGEDTWLVKHIGELMNIGGELLRHQTVVR